MPEHVVHIVEIKNLKQLLVKNPNASIPLHNPDSGKVERILVADLVGGETVKVPWVINQNYMIDDIAEFNNKIWKSLQDNNVGHQPYDDQTWWVEVSASSANGSALQPWAAGIFNIVNSSVTVNNAGYLLNNSVTLPFNSTDFATELASNIWLPLNLSGALKAANVIVDATGFNGNLDSTVTNVQILAQKVNDLTIASDVETLNVTTPLQTNKLLKVNATGDGVDYTAFSNDQVSHVNGLDMSLWGDGEIRPLGARRVNSTTVVAEQVVPIVDMYEPPTATKTALSTNSNWYNPDGTAKAVYVASGGVTGQRFVDANWLYECFSTFNWIRTPKTSGYRGMYEVSSATKILLENTANWGAGVYIGTAITDSYQGQRHYNQSYVFEFVDNFIPVRYSRI